MLTIILMLLDILLAFFIVLGAFRFIRVIFMRIKLVKNLKSICNNKNFVLTKSRSPFISIFYKSRKMDMTINADDTVYHIKFISSFSKKKIYHFVDENNYITYSKIYFALPMAKDASTIPVFMSSHMFPNVEKSENLDEKHVFLFNPMPNEITYIDKNGSKQIAGNGSLIGDFYVYNAKGFCKTLEED